MTAFFSFNLIAKAALMSQTPNCDRETCNGTYSSLFRRWMEARGTEVVNTPIGYGFSGNLVSATMNIDSIDRDATCCERIRDAAKTFTLSRQWPQPTEIEIGPRYVWEKVNTLSFMEIFLHEIVDSVLIFYWRR